MKNEIINKKTVGDKPKIKNKYLNIIILFLSTSFDLIRSILIRLVFSVHLLVAVSLVCYVKNDLWYLVNSIGVILIIIEWFAITLKNKGKDLAWFSPCFFIYILAIIPPTWFLEFENINNKQNSLAYFSNETKTSFLINFLNENDSSIGDLAQKIEGLPIIPLLVIPPDTNFAMYIEVTMMIIIILGRLIMPKKGITRAELSQLLLVYMSLASDIIDLLSILQEQKIYSYSPIVYATLTTYSFSLFQFCLNLVAARGRSLQSSHSDLKIIYDEEVEQELSSRLYSKALHNEFHNVLITLCMQDLPFFILRTYCVVKFEIVSYLFLFFLFKNGIIFSLQTYRILAILTDKDFTFRIHNKKEIV